jgi:fructokinase
VNALGIDLGGTKIEAVVLADDGTERWRLRVATPAGRYDDTLASVAALAAAADAAGHSPFSVGIGTPGTPAANGLMKNCNSQCLNGRPLQHDLALRLQQPVALANDANCLALSEASDGAGAGAGVVFAVILGTGTGAGIAVDGRVLTGPNGLAGEWGHNPLPWGTPWQDPQHACYCGRSGCVETLLSGPGMARDHALVNGGKILDGPAIVAAAAAGDAAATATLQRHAERLARALAAVVNLLDPDVIVLGGGLSRLPQLAERVAAQWGRWVFSGGQVDAVQTPLRLSLHGDASGVRGAAWLGRQLAAARV